MGISQASLNNKHLKFRTGFIFLFISLLALIVYSNSIHNEFVRDDGFLIQENLSIRSISNIWDLLIHSYRPLRMISYAIDYHFWALNPVGYHITNILLHIFCCYWVYAITLRLTRDSRASFYTAILFAVHPIHTDAVTYVSGRRDVLFTFFYLMAFYYFLSYRESGKFRYVPVIFGAFVLSLLSKEMAASLPFLFFGYEVVYHFHSDHPFVSRGYFVDLYRTAGQSVKRDFVLYASMFLLVLASVYYYVIWEKSSLLITQGQIHWWGGTIFNNFLTVVGVIIYDVKKTFLPIVLMADYTGFPIAASVFDIRVLFSLTVLLSLMILLMKLMNKKKLIAFSMALFFITLLPVMQIIPHHELLAEHYLYLPSFGICLLISLGFRWVEKTAVKGSQFAFVIFALMILLFSLRTLDRNKDWSNEIALYGRDLQTNPENKRAHLLMGVNYMDAFLYEKAMTEFDKATEGFGIFQDAYIFKGYIYFRRGEFLTAISEAKKALEIQKKDFGHLYLGEYYLALGEKEKALDQFQRIETGKDYLTAIHYRFLIFQELWNQAKADEMADLFIRESEKILSIVPDDEQMLLNLARCYEWKLSFDKSMRIYESLDRHSEKYSNEAHRRREQIREIQQSYLKARQILEKNPEDNDGLLSLGKVPYKLGRYVEASKVIQGILVRDPGFTEAYYTMAMLYEQKKDLDNAISSMNQATVLQNDNPQYHYFLGHLYARKLEFEPCILEFKQAQLMGMNGRSFQAEYDKAILNKKRYDEAARNESMSDRIDLARVYLDYEYAEKAFSLLQDVEKKSEDTSETLHQIGSLYEKMGYRYVGDAIRIYKRIVQISPDDAKAYAHLGYIYWKDVRELPLVVKYFSKSLALDPSQGQADEMRKVIKELKEMYSKFFGQRGLEGRGYPPYILMSND